MPPWATAIQMGEAFGMWPEDVMHAAGGLVWAARFTAYRKAYREAQEYKNKG